MGRKGHFGGGTRVRFKKPRREGVESKGDMIARLALGQRVGSNGEPSRGVSRLGQTIEGSTTDVRAHERLARREAELREEQHSRRLLIRQATDCRATYDGEPQAAVCARYKSGNEVGARGICLEQCGRPRGWLW